MLATQLATRPAVRFGLGSWPVPSPVVRWGPGAWSHRPQVSVDVTPGLAVGGDRVDVLAMVGNEHPRTLRGLWLGLVLPASVDIDDIVVPAGSAALTGASVHRVVTRCPIADLEPGGSMALEVELRAPRTSGRFLLTAFVTVDVDPAATFTAARVLPVL